MKSINSLNHRDWSYIRRIKGLIMLIEITFNYLKKWIQRTESTKKTTQKIDNKLKNYEEFAVSDRTEPDNWESMNFVGNRKRNLPPWICFCLCLRVMNSRTRWIPWMMRKISMIQWKRADLDCPTFPANPWEFRFKKDHPQDSRIPGIWHHLLADWHQVTPGMSWNMEKDWDESRRVQQYQLLDFPGSMKPGNLWIVLEELIFKIVWWNLRGILSGNCTPEESQTEMTFIVWWRSMLES